MSQKQILEISVRNTNQLGHALRRFRKQDSWVQSRVGERAGVRQKVVSAVEAGVPGTRMETLFKLLAALDLELVVRKRKKENEMHWENG